jgi:hypothetical protein
VKEGGEEMKERVNGGDEGRKVERQGQHRLLFLQSQWSVREFK